MTVITRFAPAPTGYLHIGSARTALFNWLFARHNKGQFLLRIEDTDRVRSTEDSIQAIFDGLSWLGINWDQEPIYQFSRAERHREIALQLLKQGRAYYCYCSQQELEEMREGALKKGQNPKYNGLWRDRDAKQALNSIKPVIRLKTPQSGSTYIKDSVQGEVTIENSQLDDFILLRADGTPTYMLSVVVDDHDMNISHIIRGDDHFTNSFRQKQIYDAMNWSLPSMTHIPLIHADDGAKLSKRHGAPGIDAFKQKGIIPEALCNYLLRLGWSHGDDEIITQSQAIEWFDLEGIGKSPARLNLDKMMSINSHYLRQKTPQQLIDLIQPILCEFNNKAIDGTEHQRLLKGMSSLVERAKNLNDLAQGAKIYLSDQQFTYGEEAQKFLLLETAEVLSDLAQFLNSIESWYHDPLEQALRQFCEQKKIKLGQVAQPLRIALTGSLVSPGIFEIMEILEKKLTLERIQSMIEFVKHKI